MTSPIESWRPNINRTQSWNQQDLKRELQKDAGAAGASGSGDRKGFTEGGEATRKVGV